MNILMKFKECSNVHKLLKNNDGTEGLMIL